MIRLRSRIDPVGVGRARDFTRRNKQGRQAILPLRSCSLLLPTPQEYSLILHTHSRPGVLFLPPLHTYTQARPLLSKRQGQRTSSQQHSSRCQAHLQNHHTPVPVNSARCHLTTQARRSKSPHQSHAAAAACICHRCIHHPGPENQHCYSQNQHHPQDQHHRHVPLHLAPPCVATLGGGGEPATVLVDPGGAPAAGHPQESGSVGGGHGQGV